MKVIALLLFVATYVAGNQTPPGTSSRPILTASEANYYTKSRYLQGWSPPSISTYRADYTVGGGYNTIQAAVNAAIKAGGTTRKYIKINPGTYRQVVYIPNTNVPLTIFGGGGSASNTLITLNLPAQTTPSAYKNMVNPNGAVFRPGDPAYKMYNSCASKGGTIGTGCSAVFWVQAPNVQIVNLSVQNSAANSGDQQAVALATVNDKIQVHNARLLGHQDTFYAGSSGTSAERIHVTKTHIEGDIDFVFGGGSVVFEGCTFHAKVDRRRDIAVIFAPSTHPRKMYGYLVISSTITGDNAWASSRNVYLARAWDAGVPSAGAYVPGTSPNGQLVIRETTINGVVKNAAPWTKATSGRAYSGNAAKSRDLNNHRYNRFWEHANRGNGA